jgi:hypothetical protein
LQVKLVTGISLQLFSSPEVWLPLPSRSSGNDFVQVAEALEAAGNLCNILNKTCPTCQGYLGLHLAAPGTPSSSLVTQHAAHKLVKMIKMATASALVTQHTAQLELMG